MFIRKNVLMIWAMIFILLPFADAIAAENMAKDAEKDGVEYSVGIELMYPSDRDRDIHTVNLDVYRRIAELKNINLSIHAGLTVTSADGDITQQEGGMSEGTLREVNYDNHAAGIGPCLLVDLRLWGSSKLSLHLESSGAVLLYDKKFPAGGDRYNFMWRGGPFVKYHISNDQKMGIGYHWMHVSNGQGTGAQNPSYDAQGLRLTYSFVF